MYDDCQRKWAYKYYEDNFERPLYWQVKAANKLQPATAFAGTVFHDVIEQALKTFVATGALPSSDDMVKAAKSLARDTIEFSWDWSYAVQSNNKWPRRQGLRPIDVIYYDGTFPREFKVSIAEKFGMWTSAFKEFVKGEELLSVPPGQWRFPNIGSEAYPWFWHGEVPVYASYDFALSDPEQTRIYDWKTGDRTKGEDYSKTQILHYAGFAKNHWEIPLASIECYVVWLDDGSVSYFTPKAPELKLAEDGWTNQHARLKQKVEELRADPTRILELFPLTDNVEKCQYCQYRFCEGRGRLPQIKEPPLPWDVADDNAS